MNRLISSIIMIAVTYIAWVFATAIQSYAEQEPEKVTLSKNHQFVRCPACHLEKRPPNPCPQPMQAWAWEECMDIANRHPKETAE